MTFWIKSFYEVIILVWDLLRFLWKNRKLLQILKNFIEQISPYPGLEDSETLRVWLIDVTNQLDLLPDEWKTPSARLALDTLRRIAQSNAAWPAFYKALKLADSMTKQLKENNNDPSKESGCGEEAASETDVDDRRSATTSQTAARAV